MPASQFSQHRYDKRRVLDAVRAPAFICGMIFATLGVLLFEANWAPARLGRLDLVETERQNEMNTANGLKVLMNDPEHSEKNERDLEAPGRVVKPCGQKAVSPVPEIEGPQSATANSVRSKLDPTLLSLLQTKGEGAALFQAELNDRLDIELDGPVPHVGVFIQVKEGRIEQLLANGFAVHNQIGDVVTSKIPICRLEELAGLSDVISVEASFVREPLLDHDTPDIGVDQVSSPNHIPVEKEIRDDRAIVADLTDLLNDPALRGNLDDALIDLLQATIKDGLTQTALPVKVQVSRDSGNEVWICLMNAGLFIQTQAGNVLTGTILTADLRRVLLCKDIEKVRLAKNDN